MINPCAHYTPVLTLSLLWCYYSVFTKGKFRESYIPTVFDNTVAEVEVDGRTIELTLWDTAGQEDYDRLRTLSYSNAHVVLICFAIDSPDTLDNVNEKWLAETNGCCKNVRYILVGCKMDLRTDKEALKRLQQLSQRPVSTEEGKKLAETIGTKDYIECSAKNNEGVQEVFEAASRVALKAHTQKRQRNHKKCIIS